MAKRKSTTRTTLGVVGYNKNDVIRIILDVSGKYRTRVNARGIMKKNLVDNLDYTDELLENLLIELDRYVKELKATAEVPSDDFDECETVGDVIDLVEEQLDV